MARTFLASVANADAFVKDGDMLRHVLSAKTLTESTIGFSSTTEEVRGGMGGKLYGRFVHTSGMTVTLTDAMFDIDYLRYQIGAEDLTDAAGTHKDKTVIFNEGDSKKGSEITAVTGFDLTNIPKSLGMSSGLEAVAIWLRPVGTNASKAADVTLIIGQNANFADSTGTVQTAESKHIVVNEGTILSDVEYCISYIYYADAAEAYKVLAEFNPAQMILIMSANLYVGDANNVATGSKWGTFVVKIPRFQLDGAVDLSMAMTSAATISLSGSALAVDDGSCEGKGVYAEIVISPDAAVNMDQYRFIHVDEDYCVGGKTPVVWGFTNAGKMDVLDNSYCTFTNSDDESVLDSDGKWKVPSGSNTYEATVTLYKETTHTTRAVAAPQPATITKAS